MIRKYPFLGRITWIISGALDPLVQEFIVVILNLIVEFLFLRSQLLLHIAFEKQ
jgi:hypothetical protein